MSKLTFDRHAHTLTLFSEEGRNLGTWDAYHKVTADSNGKWPNGIYKYRHYNAHDDHTIDTAYGSLGIFVFTVPGRSGMGVHAGRQNVADKKGRKGPEHNTRGCIRTTEDALRKIK